MIVTVTPNPSLDRTLVLATRLRPGQVHRATASRTEASGKGVNVTRVLRANGIDSTAVLPLGGAAGAELRALLVAQQVPFAAVPIAGRIRGNVTVLDGRSGTTKLNEPGPELSAAEIDELVATTAKAVRTSQARWLAICGSLPPGAPPGLVTRLVAAGHAGGAAVAVDSSGAGLAEAVRAGADLVAPNGEELAELAGQPVTGPDSAAEAAANLFSGTALVSLGELGAVLVRPNGTAMHAVPPPVTVVNTAGAGDALLAGWLAAEGPAAARLARAVAWGTGACLAEGTAELPGHPVAPELVTTTELEERA
ncbi:1-phosphofructokinase family hexose kinase [Crossiella sp. CA-258035]|uniref:1-phosphofructokinase family hexose kinase n=1 Tax=Crossiella sp. CA-258035 TaxID=2981138 RepID=UPI0024BC55BF|nr:1-phosphofructokinase family hexose kinase [Crossiella sp. CA-258035]WHT19078.1 1-phosphofructokinase family hexose kinase [Crossiella sp. CA-258035]